MEHHAVMHSHIHHGQFDALHVAHTSIHGIGHGTGIHDMSHIASHPTHVIIHPITTEGSSNVMPSSFHHGDAPKVIHLPCGDIPAPPSGLLISPAPHLVGMTGHVDNPFSHGTVGASGTSDRVCIGGHGEYDVGHGISVGGGGEVCRDHGQTTGSGSISVTGHFG